MEQVMSERTLRQENVAFHGTGGRSQENRSAGFLPAFFDVQTETVYPSCFADGRPAPVHLLDGLPDEVVVSRHATGRVLAVKASVISGFVRAGQFYTRAAAAQAVAQPN